MAQKSSDKQDFQNLEALQAKTSRARGQAAHKFRITAS